MPAARQCCPGPRTWPLSSLPSHLHPAASPTPSLPGTVHVLVRPLPAQRTQDSVAGPWTGRLPFLRPGRRDRPASPGGESFSRGSSAFVSEADGQEMSLQSRAWVQGLQSQGLDLCQRPSLRFPWCHAALRGLHHSKHQGRGCQLFWVRDAWGT